MGGAGPSSSPSPPPTAIMSEMMFVAKPTSALMGLEGKTDQPETAGSSWTPDWSEGDSAPTWRRGRADAPWTCFWSSTFPRQVEDPDPEALCSASCSSPANQLLLSNSFSVSIHPGLKKLPGQIPWSF